MRTYTIKVKPYIYNMKIKELKIEGLFNLFNYTIPFDNEENLLIITGPNGFGKTMILNIINNLFTRNFSFFQKLVFTKISLALDKNINIVISKLPTDGDKKWQVSITVLEDDKPIDELSNIKLIGNIERIIDRYMPYFRRIDDDKWVDVRTDRLVYTDEIILNHAEELPSRYKEELYGSLKISTPQAKAIFEDIKVHLIKEQRLIRVNRFEQNAHYNNRNETSTTETIQEYAKELRELISSTLKKSYEISQELDSSFPKRLLGETAKLEEPEFQKRFNYLKAKQEKLKKYNLSESEQEVPPYNEDDARVLLVYLKDSESKLSVFDDLLKKLELFTNILNERRFTYKSIVINKEKGFIFETIQGEELELRDLSSGEQHEVVLLYELIFKASADTLVLIDEPEISLHITWQKEFLNDLLRIIELQKMHVVIATHSPQIINGRWDLVYNLEKKKQGE